MSKVSSPKSDSNRVIFNSYDEAIEVVNRLRVLTRKYCSLSCIDHSGKDILAIKEIRVFNVPVHNRSLEGTINSEFFKLDKEMQHIISYYFRIGDFLSLRNILSMVFMWYPKTLVWCNKKFKKIKEIC